MPKFDYIIQNPPYSGNLHIQIEKHILDNVLNDDGKMVIIQPASWLIDVRKPTGRNKNAPIFEELKNKLGKHVYKVVIENLNKQFDTALYVPFSITYIDNKKEYNNIELVRCGETLKVNNLYDCNMIGDYDMIWSILNKIKSYSENVGTMKEHIYKEGKTKTDENTEFINFADILGQGGCGSHGYGIFSFNDNEFQKIKFGSYQNSLIDVFVRRTETKTYQLFGSMQELENWKHFVFNNKIPLFTSIVLIISQNNRVKDIIPWLVDKQYTDDEIYQMLNITEEEQKFIDKTLKRYERNSPWFKRYMCGSDSISDEEVQKFIDLL